LMDDSTIDDDIPLRGGGWAQSKLHSTPTKLAAGESSAVNETRHRNRKGETRCNHVIRSVAYRSYPIYHHNYPSAKYINLSCLHEVEIVVQSLVISRRVSPIVEERSRARTRHQQTFQQYELMPERWTHSLTRLLAPRAGFLVACNVEPVKEVEQRDATR
jgi:hypothetical protein